MADTAAAAAAATDAPLPTTPPAAGYYSVDTAYLNSNFASLAAGGTAARGAELTYSNSAYSYSAPGGTVQVNGLSPSEVNGASNGSAATGWAGLSDTVKYVIYAAAGVVGLAIIGLVTWLLVRRSRKRKQQEERSKARMTTRSSFASPMHERETMQPNSANAYNFANVDTYKSHQGPGGAPMSQPDGNVSFSSIDKGNYGMDARSVHSVPPAYGHGQKNHQNHYNHPADESDTTLINGPPSSDGHGGDGNTIHPMLANVNTGLSSFKPVSPESMGSHPLPSVPVVAAPLLPSRQESRQERQRQDSYPPPRMQSQSPQQYERSGTPQSSARQQPQQQLDGAYQQQQNMQPYSRNGPSRQQQQQGPRYARGQGPAAQDYRQAPPSPAYSASTLASPRPIRDRNDTSSPGSDDYFTPMGQAYGQGYANDQQQYQQGYPSRALSPVSPPPIAGQTQPAGGHRYRMPPQNRNTHHYQQQQNQMAYEGQHQTRNQSYQNPYAAFAEDEGSSPPAAAAAAAAGQGGYEYEPQSQQRQPRQQQQQQQPYRRHQQAQDGYFPPQPENQYNKYR